MDIVLSPFVEQFETQVTFDEKSALLPIGHTLLHSENGVEYIYFAEPFPLVRVRATAADLKDPTRYQAYTCLEEGTQLAAGRVAKKQGRADYAWRTNTALVRQEDQGKLVREGKLPAGEVLLPIRDVATGAAVHASSAATAAAVRSLLGTTRVHVVPLGVNTELFRPSENRVRNRIIAIASADVPLKGVAHLLNAVARLRVERDLELQLVAKLEPNGPTEKLIAELGISDIVHSSSGVTDAELAELLASAEIACIPSLYEGFSLPAVEAMASGTPIVASRAGALPEVVGADGECARLVTPADVDELTRVLAELLDSPLELRRLGANGRKRALDVFSWESVAAQTVAVYEQARERVAKC